MRAGDVFGSDSGGFYSQVDAAVAVARRGARGAWQQCGQLGINGAERE